MEEQPKKLTFGFSKVIKKPNLMQGRKLGESQNKVEMIKCLEGKSIQLVEEKPEEKPLVIPLLDSRKTSAALASLQKRKEVLDGVEAEEPAEEVQPTAQPTDNSLESKAVRELLSEVNQETEEDSSKLVLPLKPEDLPLEGAKESSMDDYESIPINQFGLAMLRGMGWKEEPSKKKDLKDLDSPFVRPKGMGLGADKAIKAKPLLVAPEQNEILEVKKNAYVRVLAGKHKDLYAQVEGLDDHAGRVIVKMALGGSKESFNEFLLQAVSKKEFQQYGKVINAEKYDKYKKMENEFGQIKVEQFKEEIKKEVKKERNSEDRWQHDKYERNGGKEHRRDRRKDDYERDSRKEDRSSRDSRRDDYQREPRKEDRDSRRYDKNEGREERNSRDSRKDDYQREPRKEDRDSRRYDKNEGREERNSRDSRRDERSSRKEDRWPDKYDDKSSRNSKREESQKVDYEMSSRKEERRYDEKSSRDSRNGSRRDTHRDSSSEDDYQKKHKSKKSSKKYSSDSDSDSDYSRKKKSSKKNKKHRSRSRSRGRR